jgi:hypothetical protein
MRFPQPGHNIGNPSILAKGPPILAVPEWVGLLPMEAGPAAIKSSARRG